MKKITFIFFCGLLVFIEIQNTHAAGKGRGRPYCGNGVIEGSEQCDDGNTTYTDRCAARCRQARCGDFIVWAGVEECDDGNDNNTDACRNNCHRPRCGDGVVDTGEQCDDGDSVSGDGCSSTCWNEPRCGNGSIETGEQCDDGNTANFDGCDNGCLNGCLSETWTRIFDSSARDEGSGGGRDIGLDDDGNIYVVGVKNSPTARIVLNQNFYVAQHNRCGERQWFHFLRQTGEEIVEADRGGVGGVETLGFGIAVDGKGNSYVTGQTSAIARDASTIIRKYDENGTALWTIYDCSMPFCREGRGGKDIILTSRTPSSEYLYTTGFHTYSWPEFRMFWVGKYSMENGLPADPPWPLLAYADLSYVPDPVPGPSPASHSDALTSDSSGNVYVAINDSEVYWSGYEILIKKITPDGNDDPLFGEGQGITFSLSSVEDRRYENRLRINGIAVDSENNVIVVGRSGASGDGERLIIIKLDNLGNLIPNFPIRESALSNGHAITVDAYNNIFVTGSIGRTILLRKYSPEGTLLWENNSGDGTGKGIVIGPDTGIYVTGWWGSVPRYLGQGVFIRKYTTEGISDGPITYDYSDNL